MAVKETFGKRDTKALAFGGPEYLPLSWLILFYDWQSVKTPCARVCPPPSLPFCETFVSTCQRPLVATGEPVPPEMAGETFCLPK